MISSMFYLLDGCMQDMKTEVLSKYPNETGGCLMGYFSENDDEVVITDIIGPGGNAIHRPSYFCPDSDFQEKEIARIYNESGRRTIYLGDWHMHPLPNKYLSWRDKKTLRKIARHKPARISNPLMGVFYYDEDWELVIWQLKKLNSFLFYDGSVYEEIKQRK